MVMFHTNPHLRETILSILLVVLVLGIQTEGARTIRLVGSSVGYAGRVEVLRYGVWGTVCDASWDISDARVACRELGYNDVIDAPCCGRFGSGTGRVWLSLLQCSGNEASLLHCTQGKLGNTGCWHLQDAGVVCNTSQAHQSEIKVRLSGGNSPRSGRVEIRYAGVWGTVYDGSWDIKDGHVICRQAGYSNGALAVYTKARYGPGTGPVWMSYVRCKGTEDTVQQCIKASWGRNTFPHSSDASVECNTNSSDKEVIKVRLVGAPSPNAGLVEVFYNNSWGGVCSLTWRMAHANVICRQLGYSGALAYTRRSVFVRSRGLVLMDGVHCSGDEKTLSQCAHRGWGRIRCSAFRRVGVVCKTSETIRQEISVRLASGSNQLYAGRVEIRYGGIWGTLYSGSSWDIMDGHVICRQLNYSGTIAVFNSNRHGAGSGPVWLMSLKCHGNESSLGDCPFSGGNYIFSRHISDASVICNATGAPTFNVKLRLVGSKVPHAGRVEVLHDRVWGTVCDDKWDIVDANLVCRQLGYPRAWVAPCCASYGEGSGKIWLDELRCVGKEKSLTECPHQGWGRNNCGHKEDASVVCETKSYTGKSDGAVRLRGAPVSYAGRVEIQFGGVWGTFCSIGWNSQDADVICRQLGYPGSSATIKIPVFGQGTGPGWAIEPRCNGTESNITLCAQKPWTSRTCTHYSDASVVCRIGSHSEGIKVRLGGSGVPGPYAGRVELFVAGLWGTIPDTVLDARAGNVICRMVGYTKGVFGIYTMSRYGSGTGPAWLSKLECLGDERSISQCNLTWAVRSYYNHLQDASIECISNDSSRQAISYRLTGTGSNEGFVQVRYGARWGSICSMSWSIVDARVLCRQLGFNDSLIATSSNANVSHLGIAWMALVECRGWESSLTKCPHAGWKKHHCYRGRAKVVCMPINHSTNDIPLRLQGTNIPSTGRLEALYGGVWGTVCSYGFDTKAANVSCRDMGFAGAEAIVKFNIFGKGTGHTWLSRLRCTGHETSLMHCGRNPIGSSCFTGHVGLVCRSNATSNGLKVRLVGRHSNSTGRVEVLFGGVWGSVSSDLWDIRDGHVVCRMLGFSKAVSVYTNGDNGRGTGPVWLSALECAGTEDSLDKCKHARWASKRIPHRLDSSVECYTRNNEKAVSLRLVQGPDGHAGQLEIKYRDVWSAVCGDSWDSVDAQVACRQLGYPLGALVAMKGRPFGIRSYKGRKMWLQHVECRGFEDSLAKCTHRGWGRGYTKDRPYCYYSTGYANVVCKTNDTSLNAIEVRLNGTLRANKKRSPHAGRVEIRYGGVWGTVCKVGWNKNDADVICRQLGYSESSVVLQQPLFGHGLGPVWLSDLRCSGTEKSIEECPHALWGSKVCSSAGSVGVICRTDNNTDNAKDVKVRLVGGLVPFAGRVEVFHAGFWGSIPTTGNLDFREGLVICRQLGYKGLAGVFAANRYGKGSGIVWLSNLQCRGNESSIAKCHHTGWTLSTDANSITVSLECRNDNKSLGVSVRLAGSSAPHAGRVEVFVKGRWGTVCDDSWDITDANVVCKELGYRRAAVALCCSFFGRGRGSIWLSKLRCTGHERSLSQCGHDGWGVHSCSRWHSNDASVVCLPLNNSTAEIKIHLINTKTQAAHAGRVEVRYYGVWGRICPSGWDKRDADVVCRQLGYPSALINISTDIFGRSSGPTWLPNINCYGSETGLEKCTANRWGGKSCSNYWEDAAVICKQRNNTQDGAVRLRGANVPNAGRVEISFAGIWGVVSDIGWNIRAGHVVCRQLGYPAAQAVYRNYIHGYAKGPRWISDLQCSGNESVILECPLHGRGRSWGIFASVECLRSDANRTGLYVPVRLVGAGVDYAGRVEILYKGTWGTVCGNDWPISNARVLCRQLGLGPPLTSQCCARFGQGTGKIWIDGVRCIGYEASFSLCPHRGWGRAGCGYRSVASVVCTPGNLTTSDIAVRLNGSSSSNAGRIEIRYAGIWGKICGTKWDMNDANTACRQLGFQKAVHSLQGLYSGGSGPWWLYDLRCRGTESSLAYCSHTGWGGRSTCYNYDAGVICSNSSQITQISVRLSGGPNPLSGRVEVNIFGVWGTVNTVGWDINDARVVCRQLGYREVRYIYTGQLFGQGNGPKWLSDLRCLGNEKLLMECPYRVLSSSSRYSTTIAGVECTNSSHVTGLAIRLVEGSSNSGRLEIRYNHRWGTICDDKWGLEEAIVVCRQLGFRGVKRYYTHSLQGTGPIWMDHVKCTGKELVLSECVHRGWGRHTCSHSEDVGVVCKRFNANTTADYKIRLVGAQSSDAGRVEIRLHGVWGTVCNDYWGYKDARVVCRELGFKDAINTTDQPSFGAGSGPIWLDDVNCRGTEKSILQCSHRKLATHNCNHREDAGVHCVISGARKPANVRLAGSKSTASFGRVEIFYAGEWGTVCDKGWNLQDGHVVCRQLGFAEANTVTKGASFGNGSGNVWLDNVRCHGNESALSSCMHSGWMSSTCTHDRDAGVICSTTVNWCRSDPCVNGGTCQSGSKHFTCSCTWDFAGEMCQVFVGNNSVVLEIRMDKSQWDAAVFKTAVATALQVYCEGGSCTNNKTIHVRKRSVSDTTLQQSDILIMYGYPKPSHDPSVLLVRFAILQPGGDSKTVVSKRVLKAMVQDSVVKISQGLGHSVISVDSEEFPTPQPRKHNKPITPTVMVVSVLVPVIVLIIIITAVLWRWRRHPIANFLQWPFRRFKQDTTILMQPLEDSNIQAEGVQHPRYESKKVAASVESVNDRDDVQTSEQTSALEMDTHSFSNPLYEQGAGGDAINDKVNVSDELFPGEFKNESEAEYESKTEEPPEANERRRSDFTYQRMDDDKTEITGATAEETEA